ncbi:hypothetical protein TWF506_007286 [Arthrobotrys conoides]|uniref:Uncharacterized protein n=1 Tax=Arthrobotrys conoides TaxID=74498 RepID=A0AAN8PHB5_9PEZI
MKMYLPPEILLQILEPYRNTNNTTTQLSELRLVNSHFNNVIISYFAFPKKIKLVYGFEEAMVQMKTLGRNTVMLRNVRGLFIPSESFFPGGLGASRDNQIFPWTRQPDHNNGSIQTVPGQHSITNSHSTFENPQNPSFQVEAEQYLNTLQTLLYTCKNLEVLEIAMGNGWDTLRMKYWTGIFMKRLWKVIGKVGVKKVRIMMPYVHHMGMFFRGWEEEVGGIDCGNVRLEFPKLQSVAVMINSTTPSSAWGYDETTLKEHFAKTLKFFFHDEPIRVMDTRDAHNKAIWNTFKMGQLDWRSRYFLGERTLRGSKVVNRHHWNGEGDDDEERGRKVRIPRRIREKEGYYENLDSSDAGSEEGGSGGHNWLAS